MAAPNINTAKGLAKLIQSQIQLAKIGEATGDEFNWETLIKDYAKNQVKLSSSKDTIDDPILTKENCDRCGSKIRRRDKSPCPIDGKTYCEKCIDPDGEIFNDRFFRNTNP